MALPRRTIERARCGNEFEEGLLSLGVFEELLGDRQEHVLYDRIGHAQSRHRRLEGSGIARVWEKLCSELHNRQRGENVREGRTWERGARERGERAALAVVREREVADEQKLVERERSLGRRKCYRCD